MIQANGLPLRADDHGNTPQTAAALGSLTTYAATGVIGSRTDTDVFALELRCPPT